MRDPVIVTGAARSGTSLVMGVLEACGLQTGDTCGPTEANPKGQWENRGIIQQVQKPYLKAIGADPMGQHPLPSYEDLTPDPYRRLTVLDIADEQGIDTDYPWGFKDAKALLDWPIWNQAFPNATWIVTKRDLGAIAASAKRTSFMRKAPDWLEWAKFHEERANDIPNAHQIQTRALAEGHLNQAKEAVNKCGLDFDLMAVTDWIDPELWHE